MPHTSSPGIHLANLQLAQCDQIECLAHLILPLGVDYQGGTEDMYKSVKIRIEVGREWQAGANAFKCVTLSILALISFFFYV